MDRLTESFIHSPSLNNHINFLFSKGEMYTVFDNNLLFHGCIPMNEATFESYFIKEAKSHKENKNPYYILSEEEKYCNKILKEFGLDDEDSRIVNGHIPVKVKDGESSIKANGKLLIIDGGFAKSFREKTGNAGYVLTYNSNGLLLSQTKPFESVSKAIIEEKDIISEIIVKKNGVLLGLGLFETF